MNFQPNNKKILNVSLQIFIKNMRQENGNINEKKIPSPMDTNLAQEIILPEAFEFIQKVMINVGLASFFMGYTMVYFNTIEFSDLMVIFNLKIDKSLAQGLLTGCIPASACIGGLVSKYMMTEFSRKNCFYVLELMCILSVIMIQTKEVWLVFAGRLLQGGYIGVGSAIVPLYIKEFVPQLNGKYGMLHQLLFVFGVVWAFLLSMILHSVVGETENYWRIVFGFAMLVAGWQGCMMHWRYDFETPRYLVSDNRNEEARELLKMIYKPQYAEREFRILYQAVHSKKFFLYQPDDNIQSKQYGQQSPETKQIQLKYLNQPNKDNPQPLKQSLLPPSNPSKPPNNPLAIFCALHISFEQQIIGIGAVIVYAGDIVKEVVPELFYYYGVVVHGFGLMCVAVGLKIVQKVGRVKLLQYGGVAICCCLLVTGINFLRDKQDRNDYAILIAVVLLRGVFSFTLGPIVWLYMAEIVKPNIIPYGTIVNWFGATLVMLLFPILKQHLGGPGWIFIFNACFCLLSIIINAFTLVETKDKHQLEIRQHFDQELEMVKKLPLFGKCFHQ